MKTLIHILTVCLFSIATLYAKEVEVNKTFDLSKVESFTFVDEVPIENDFGYKKLKLSGVLPKNIKASLALLGKEKASAEPQAPFIGILGNVLLLDKTNNPVCAISVINFNRTIVIRDVKIANNSILIGDVRMELKSDEVCRWIYDHVKKDFPKEFASQQAFYKKTGKSIEEYLFPKRESN